MNYKRVFLIVIDSLGVGELEDASNYGDEGSNTLKHIAEECKGIHAPNLASLGLGYTTEVFGMKKPNNPLGVVSRMKEKSLGKDTITGHWELMGLMVERPFITFTNEGFPKELIDTLEYETGYKVLGNIAVSGTKIIKDFGTEHLAIKSIIVYTSADSVMQIAAHESVLNTKELYKICETARRITMKDEWRVARVIARPFRGDAKNGFERKNSERHDYSISPFAPTILDNLSNSGYETIAIGKIVDIFNGKGITKYYRSKSSIHGMEQTTQMLDEKFKGLCFTNLVDFDSLYGHRRDPHGYGKAIEDFDFQLSDFIAKMKKDDLLILTADHGNDPTFKGSDHTREHVPLIAFSKSLEGKVIDTRNSFSDIGATIADIFNVEQSMIGESFLNELVNK